MVNEPTGGVVYANWGRWVAGCKDPDCWGAASLVPFESGFRCDSCGQPTDVLWPSEDMVRSVERLLLMRPVRQTQNWLPGETLTDLMRENAEHGVFSRYEVGGGPSIALVAREDALTIDRLPVLNPRRELVA